MLFIVSQTFINYLNFATLLIGVFAFVDFIIRFKRPYNFKIFYSIFLLSLLTLDFLIWVRMPFFDIVRFSPFINFGVWCAGLYTLSILTTGKIEKWVWLSSAVIFTLNCYNYFMLMRLQVPNHNDFSVFSSQIDKKSSLLNITRFIQRMILLISIYLLYKTIQKYRIENNAYQSRLNRWIGLYIGFVFIAMGANFVFSYFLNGYLFRTDNFFIIYSLFCLSIFILTIYRPNFINNQNFTRLKFNRFSLHEDLRLTDTNFFIPFFNQQYFLNKEATIEDFCSKMKIEERDSFNEQIITKYNMSFSNLINKQRVEYFIFLAKDPKFKNHSIEALSKAAGFNSRTALYKPFKKFHGGTPIEFIDSIND